MTPLPVHRAHRRAHGHRRNRLRWRSLLRARANERCQFEASPYRYDWPYRWAREIKHRGALLLHHAQEPPSPGRPSAYGVGDWVRVKEASAIRATLDPADRLRGLRFTTEQWGYCGHIHQVERVVRQILDDAGGTRAISGTVALRGGVCDGPDGSGGCGHSCSLYFRDEWLEPAEADVADPPQTLATARVKSLAEITATLDRHGQADGIPFTANMASFAGGAFAVLHKLEDRFPLPHWKRPRADFYILDGVRCNGEPLGGACDRNCALLWHRSWLEFDGASGDLAPFSPTESAKPVPGAAHPAGQATEETPEPAHPVPSHAER